LVGSPSLPGVADLVPRYRPPVLFARDRPIGTLAFMRACTKCGEVKPLDAFPPVRRGEPKLQTWCRDCFAQYGREYYRTNRDVQKARLLRNAAATRAENRRRIIEYLSSHPCVDCGETDMVVLEFDHRGHKVADISTYANSGRTWARIEREIAKCEVRCANCHRRRTRATLFPERKVVELQPLVARATPAQLTLDAALGLRTCRVCKEVKNLTEFPLRSLIRQTRQWICLSCQRVYTKEWYQRNRDKQIAAAYVRRVNEANRLGRRIRDYLCDHPCVDCGESDPDVLDFDHLRDKRADVSTLVHIAVSWEMVLSEIAKCEVRCANCHRRRTAIRGRYYRTLATIARIDELAR
jgi:hypothetical protein